MKVYWKLLAAGVLGYLIFLVVTFPAQFVFGKLAAQGVNASAVSGTLWKGRALNLRIGIVSLGDLDWRLKPWSLFAAKLDADFNLKRPDGFAQGAVSASLNGRIILKNVTASLPVDAIVGSEGLPGGWKGTAQAKLSELVLVQAWPTSATGVIDMIDLTGPAAQPANIGTYRVSFPAANAPAEPNALIGSIEDEQAAIAVSGTIKLSPGRNYVLDMRVAARPNAPQDIKDGMQYLGAPDAEGKRPFSVSGTL